ncbi:MAG: M60 family metallopeptidase [Proteobacteria bacterium]|nr:M60 family metallopeptidase [Pseudomonadota bacterium]MBU1685752.1 M60 family metallopeptidase [Pseudomonadota bacterium]
MILSLAPGCTSNHSIDSTATDSKSTGVSKGIEVSVQTYWQNTEIYLQPGAQVKLSAVGLWTLEAEKTFYGPEGSNAAYENCHYGELVAQVGLHYYGKTICIGEGTTFTAETVGLLYLSSWAPWDADRALGAGSVMVQIEAAGVDAPTLVPADLATINLKNLAADELEISGQHVIVTVSKAQLIKFQADAAESIEVFDNFYQSHLELSGHAPYTGQPIRYFPDADTRELGAWAWMLAGNPIRLDPMAAYGEGFDRSNLLQSQNQANSVWGFVHEMGHDFTFTNGGRYLIGRGPTEAWANIFTLYTLENSGHPEADKDDRCRDLDEYFQNGEYQTFKNDTWLPLCMLFELKELYGWQFFKNFFRHYNSLGQDNLPLKYDIDENRWAWLLSEFNLLTGDDHSELFKKYHIPLPLNSP